MEGISHEACSLAGTQGLGKLIAFYDDNGISIDGEVRGWFTDDTPRRFEAYGWHVVPKVDGHDAAAVKQAIESARRVTDKPSLICCQTIIGWGAPNKQGKEECHGAALGEAEVAATRENIGWKHAPFVIPEEIYAAWDARAKGAQAEKTWNESFNAYNMAYPELAAEFERRQNGALPENWKSKSEAFILSVDAKAENIASRKASQNALNGYGPLLPELLGGSADLTGSNLTLWNGSKALNKTAANANYIHYGVREFGMSAILNGIALHRGFIPYGATFLIFSDYARNALRLAALMKIRTLFVYTHDSIGLGEDGPTHQAVEQLATLRLIPNMSVWRPCDAVETAVAWKLAIERKQGPTCLVFSRQNLAHQQRSPAQIAAITRGGYIISEAEGGTPQAVLLATGSEVGCAMEAQKLLAMRGIKVRVVSIPSTDVFDSQAAAYRDNVLPKDIRRVAVEAGVTDGWYKHVGEQGRIVGLNRFGESAPGGVLFKHFGFTAEHIAKTVEAML
jgi:transketolase